MKRYLNFVFVAVISSFFIFSLQNNLFCLQEATKTPHQIDELVQMLGDPNPKTKETAYKEIIAIGKPAAGVLLEKAKDWKTSSTDLRIACVELLGKIKAQKAVSDLIAFLNEKSPRMRYSAARSLGDIGDKAVVAPLMDTLVKDSDWEVRKFTAEALGKLKDKKATTTLTGALSDDTSEFVRVESVRALGLINDRSATPYVKKALNDRAPSVRAQSAELLGDWSVKDAAKEMANMLEQDRSYEVRASCAYALGSLKDKTTLPSLVNALSDEYQEVRARALDSLRKLTGRDFGENKTDWQTYITKK